MAVERLAGWRLSRHEIEAGALVMSHEPADAARAQHADTVEDEQRLAVIEFGNGRIIAIAEGRA
jgi:hypothetical protein